MDQPCSYNDLHDCLRDISKVNRLTSAYAPTLQWLNYLVEGTPRTERPLHIVDVGCGYGDMLRQIDHWAEQKGLPVILTGIDLNPNAISVAKEASVLVKVAFIEGDVYDFQPPGGVDIVISSLLTHHLENHEIVKFLQWMEKTARFGWFVNDLHRQELPYYLFRILSKLANWHRFVKHDGATSILRSFRREDWEELARTAGIPKDDLVITTSRPARLCVARLQSKSVRLRRI